MAGGPGAYRIGEEEKREVLEVLEGGYLFRYGTEDDPSFKHKVIDFEREMQKMLGLEHVIATSSGTGSLQCCLAALGIGAGDEVIVPGYTFISSISSIPLSNAVPVLAEIDESLTIDPAKIEELISPQTKAIMAVHMLGNPCDLDAIMAIAKKHDLFVIEDACQALGASYKGKRLGSYGEIAAFSLNTYKTITAGDGGAVATDDDLLYERAFGFHDYGHKAARMGVEVGNRSMIGMNMRMNELTGAVALAQIRKLDNILTTLRTKKAKLKGMLTGLPNFTFRKINDEAGECATLMTMLFDTSEMAEKFAKTVDCTPIIYSGWHVYNNMEQIINKVTGATANCPYNCPRFPLKREYKKHMLPQTDDILSRAINISIGVVDRGLGSNFGININSDDDEIERIGTQIAEIVKSL